MDVTNFKALVRLAESAGQVILHHQADAVDTYLVNDNGTVYRYQIRLPAGELGRVDRSHVEADPAALADAATTLADAAGAPTNAPRPRTLRGPPRPRPEPSGYDPGVTDLRRLQYFLAVARERNFTRAAEQLHIAQPALSRQVRLLEEELGVALLHRTTHAFELTEAGAFLLERGPAVLAAADELWRNARTYGSGERGSVVIAYGASASYETAPRLVEALAARHPGVAGHDVGQVRERDRGRRRRRLGRSGTHPLSAGASRAWRRARSGASPRACSCAATIGWPATPRPPSAARRATSTVLMHPREANPGHYDAVVELCREAGFEPRVLLRSLSFDLAYTPVVKGRRRRHHRRVLAAGAAGRLGWVRPSAHRSPWR